MRTTTGAWGYERISQYWYTPVGVEVVSRRSKGWQIGFNAEYDHFWKGRQESRLGDLPSLEPSRYLYYWDAKNDQRKGYGARGSIEVVREWNQTIFVLKPFVNYWNIKDSDMYDVNLTAYEPKNETLEYGVNFGARF